MGHKTRIAFLTEYEDQSTDSLVIPEDLTTLSDEDLAALSGQASDAFDALYQNGEANLSEDDMVALRTLGEAITALNAESAVRETAVQERRDEAAALAATLAPPAAEEDAESTEEDAESTDEGGESDEVSLEESLAASGGRRELRVNLSGLRSRQTAPRGRTSDSTDPAPLTIRDVAFASTEVGGHGVGTPLDFAQMGGIVDRRLGSFNEKQYSNAAMIGVKMRQQFGVATIRKPNNGFRVDAEFSQLAIEDVLKRATDESQMRMRQEGNSLVASGGWCAPSETIYDIYDCGEVADGLVSIPEVQMNRGGWRFNRGVNFGDILSQSGFFYTEEQDIAGEYGTDADGVGNDTAGSKRCFQIDCVDFDEVRLDLDGLCLTAGLLQSRGYPEAIADAIRKALIAHEIRMDSRRIALMVAGSTAVSLPSPQVGAAAPILTAVELQAQHYRSSGSLADSTVLEGVFPQWVRGAIRSDLSRRLGVDLLSVPNSRINAWFAERQIAPQFVANWQSVGSTAASGFTSWPTEVDFLLYKAGTWLGGTNDVITLDHVYDSTLLGTNDYTALFTEEGVATFRRGCDSRVVTVPICPTGDTGGGVAIDCDGTEGA